MNMVLFTGGSSGADPISSTNLLNVNGPVENCNPPELPEPRVGHVTFVTKDSPPRLGTCGGSTTWAGLTSFLFKIMDRFFNMTLLRLIEAMSIKKLFHNDNCNLIVGTLSSQNFPSSYPNGHSRNQSMEVGDGEKILIRFTSFSLEESSSCQYDSVMIQDNDGTILMDKKCSEKDLEDIVSKTNKAKVIFKTDGSVVDKGWSLQYGSVPGCIVFDPHTKNWISGLKKLRHHRLHASVVSLAAGVYIIGGTSNHYSSDFLPAITNTGNLEPRTLDTSR